MFLFFSDLIFCLKFQGFSNMAERLTLLLFLMILHHFCTRKTDLQISKHVASWAHFYRVRCLAVFVGL